MVKAMSGMDATLLQSTEDSPIGLGSFSHSCKIEPVFQHFLDLYLRKILALALQAMKLT